MDIPTEYIDNVNTKLSFELAIRNRACRCCHKIIKPKEEHLVIYVNEWPFNRTNFCYECALGAIDVIQRRLNIIHDAYGKGCESLGRIRRYIRDT